MSAPYRRWRCWGILLLAALLVAATNPPATDPAVQREREARLQALRGQIIALNATLEGQQKAGDATRQRLREIDLKVAESARALIELSQQIDTAQAELGLLQHEEHTLLERLARERSSLARLLRSAYAVGQLSGLKLALSQDQIGRMGRVLTYHDYFNRARIAAIERLRADLARLSEVRRELDRSRLALESLRKDEQSRTRSLAGERAERETFLSTLADAMHQGSSRLELLEADRHQLEQLLSQLGDVLEDLPAELARQSFSTLKGRLQVPLMGAWARDYGAALEDGRRSSGISIQGETGAAVRAVSYGRVAFSDWLRGFGMLLIIDHGDGWMSLYGHCETLLKSEGDWVQTGEVLATVGASGGQSHAALHFELRHRSVPVNPAGWFAR